MKEVIEQVEQREDFRRWLSNGNAQLINYNIGFLDNWKYEFPLTAKLAMMQEWLREEEGLELSVEFFCDINDRHWYCVEYYGKSDVVTQYSSYNEALAEGIREALKLIKY